MSQNAKVVATRVLGGCWAQLWLVLGLAFLIEELIPGLAPEVGLTFVAAGLFLGMRLLIDPLVPDAGRAFTLSLKLASLVWLITCGLITLQGTLTGRIDFL